MSEGSITIISAAHIALKTWIAIWPNPPEPIMTHFSPGSRWRDAFFAALYAVSPASE